MGFGDSLKKWATSKASEVLAAELGGRTQDDRAASEQARDLEREREHDAEVRSLPLATVQLSVSGHATGQFSGQLHYAWNDVSPNDPDPNDPYADRPLVWFELFSESTAQPDLGGLRLRHWSFQIPGYHGDGSYDLTAIAREREAAAPEYLEWAMDFANSDDSSFYFYADGGPSTVTVADGGTRIDVTIAMSGALGDLTATATITI